MTARLAADVARAAEAGRVKVTVRGPSVTIAFRAADGDVCDRCKTKLAPGDRVGIDARTGAPSHVNARKCRAAARRRERGHT